MILKVFVTLFNYSLIGMDYRIIPVFIVEVKLIFSHDEAAEEDQAGLEEQHQVGLGEERRDAGQSASPLQDLKKLIVDYHFISLKE